MKYRNLNEYIDILNNNIKKLPIYDFNYDYKKGMTRRSKLATSMLRLQIVEVKKLINRINNCNQMLANLYKLKIDEQSILDNAKAVEFINEVKSIKNEIQTVKDSTIKDYCKKMKQCNKSCLKVLYTMDDDKDEESTKNVFLKKSLDFYNMTSEAINNPSNIPFDEELIKTPLEVSIENQKAEEAKQIDNKYNLQKDNEINKVAIFQAKLQQIEELLEINNNMEISMEIEGIKEAFPPQKIAISTEGLERLRQSEQLLNDLEEMQLLFKDSKSLLNDSSSLAKLNHRFENLKALISDAILEEEQKQVNIKYDKELVEGKMAFTEDYYLDNYTKSINNNDSNLPLEYKEAKAKLDSIKSMNTLEETVKKTITLQK